MSTFTTTQSEIQVLLAINPRFVDDFIYDASRTWSLMGTKSIRISRKIARQLKRFSSTAIEKTIEDTLLSDPRVEKAEAVLHMSLFSSSNYASYSLSVWLK